MKTTETAVSGQRSAVSHTPGPWTVVPIIRTDRDDDPLGQYRIIEVEDKLTPQYFDAEPGSDALIKIHAENKANARLIAAAPELLAALEKICSREMTAWNGQVKGILFEDICAAKTAIAKATGK